MIVHLLHGEIDGLTDRVAPEVDKSSVRDPLLGVSSLDRDALKPGGHVLDTLESAVWAFANTSSLDDAVVLAANLGGDADTRAAVTGGSPGRGTARAPSPSAGCRRSKAATRSNSSPTGYGRLAPSRTSFPRTVGDRQSNVRVICRPRPGFTHTDSGGTVRNSSF